MFGLMLNASHAPTPRAKLCRSVKLVLAEFIVGLTAADKLLLVLYSLMTHDVSLRDPRTFLRLDRPQPQSLVDVHGRILQVVEL